MPLHALRFREYALRARQSVSDTSFNFIELSLEEKKGKARLGKTKKVESRKMRYGMRRWCYMEDINVKYHCRAKQDLSIVDPMI